LEKNSCGVDISDNNLEEATKKGRRIIKMDLNQPRDIGENFDAVFISHILEHVDSPINLLRYANKQLGPKGMIVISVPNESSFANLIYPYYTHDSNHIYGFTIANMKELLSATGFDNINLYYDYYTAITKKLRINNFLKVLDVFPSFIKNPASWAFWFTAKKI